MIVEESMANLMSTPKIVDREKPVELIRKIHDLFKS